MAAGDFDEEKEEEDEEEDMDTSGEVKSMLLPALSLLPADSSFQIRQRKLRKTYKNQLMLSEWLVEVPVDIAEKWLLILCPEVCY